MDNVMKFYNMKRRKRRKYVLVRISSVSFAKG